MEIKNIHNNPKESRPFGKVWRYIIGGLRSLARPKKNTKWDYLVPLSLVGLQFIVMDYGIMNQYVQHSGEVITKSITEIKDTLIFELVYVFFVVLSIIFLTRLQRILILFISPVVAIVIATLLDKILETIILLESIYINIFLVILFMLPLISIEYIFGNLSILVKFGNNSKASKLKNDFSMPRKVIAYGIYGFGIDILYIYTFPQSGIDIVREFIFEGFYMAIGIPPMAPLFAVIFALIGYIIEKYKGGKTR